MTNYTPEEIWKAIVIAIAGLILAVELVDKVGKAIDRIRQWKKPKDDLVQKVEEHEKRLCSGSERFEKQDSMIGDLQEGQRILCVGMQALLESSVYGNNAAGIKNAREELNDYLTGGIGKK